MSDDDKKSPRRGWWSSTRRDLEGERARRERASSSVEHGQVGELAEAVGKLGEAIESTERVDPEDTKPTRRIEEDPDLRILRIRDDHTRAELRELITAARKDASDKLMEAMGERPPADQMSALERTIRRLRAVVIAIAIPAGTALLLVTKYVYARGADDERARIEMQQARDQIDVLTHELAEVRDLAHRTATQLEDLARASRHGVDARPGP